MQQQSPVPPQVWFTTKEAARYVRLSHVRLPVGRLGAALVNARQTTQERRRRIEIRSLVIALCSPPRSAPTVHWDVNSLVTILRQIPAEDREQIRLALNLEPVALPNNLGDSNESDH
jgi:hypothetical protein